MFFFELVALLCFVLLIQWISSSAVEIFVLFFGAASLAVFFFWFFLFLLFASHFLTVVSFTFSSLVVQDVFLRYFFVLLLVCLVPY